MCTHVCICGDGITRDIIGGVVTDSASIEAQLAANIAFIDMMSMIDASFDDARAHGERNHSGLSAHSVVVDFTAER